MYVKDLGRCFEKLDIRFEWLPTMTRGSSSKERNFLLFRAMREKTGKIFTRQGKRSFPFTRHTSKSWSADRNMGWSGRASSVCVCVHRITKDNFAALFMFTEICAMIPSCWNRNSRGVAKESAQENRLFTMDGRKKIERLLRCFFFALRNFVFCLSLFYFLKVTSVVIVKWKSFGAKELKNSENKIFKKV